VTVKCTLNDGSVEIRTGFNWLGYRIQLLVLINTAVNHKFHKAQWVYWLTERLPCRCIAEKVQTSYTETTNICSFLQRQVKETQEQKIAAPPNGTH